MLDILVDVKTRTECTKNTAIQQIHLEACHWINLNVTQVSSEL